MIESLLDQFGYTVSGTAITLGMVAIWIWRGRKLMSLIGSLAGSAITVGATLAVSLAVAVSLGWIEFHIGVMMSDLSAGFRWILGAPVDAVRSVI